MISGRISLNPSSSIFELPETPKDVGSTTKSGRILGRIGPKWADHGQDPSKTKASFQILGVSTG